MQLFFLSLPPMKKITVLFSLFFLLYLPAAFSQTVKDLQDNAMSFMQQGDFANAILVLNKAGQMEPQNIEVSKQMSMAYFLQKNFAKALETAKPLLERDDADDQCYQIAGNIYKELGQPKDCEKLFRKGIRKFPESGPIYNELGELLYAQQDYTAIKQWEKGIEVDPSFSKNYYNACRYYYLIGEKVWSIIYAEIFVNMEPTGNRTPEIKNILLESYKKMYLPTDATAKPSSPASKFSVAFTETIEKSASIASSGINAETLTMIRTRFILDWDNNYAGSFPFRLFDVQRQFLREGLFDAYNQWLFGTTQNLPAYQNWTNTHDTEYKEFIKFQKNRIFKLPKGQYYH